MKVKMLKDLPKAAYGGKVFENLKASQEIDAPNTLAKRLIETGYAAESIEAGPEVVIEEVVEAESSELSVVTSDKAQEAGLRKMRAQVICVEITTGMGGSKQAHIIMRPFNREWADQHEWYGISSAKDSAYVQLCDQLVKLGALSKDGTLLDIQGKTFEFEERENVGKAQRPKWWPISLVR
jgi:hypothetical protein